MIRPTVKELARVLTTLDKAQYARLVRVVMGLRTAADTQRPLTTYEQAFAYLYEWLLHLGVLTDDKARYLLGAVADELRRWADWADENLDDFPVCEKPVPQFLVSVIDRRYAVWPSRRRWLDVEDETEVEALPFGGQTYITCNLFGVFQAKQQWLQRLYGGKDAGLQHHAAGDVVDGGGQGEQPGPAAPGDPDQPGHARDDPPGPGPGHLG